MYNHIGESSSTRFGGSSCADVCAMQYWSCATISRASVYTTFSTRTVTVDKCERCEKNCTCRNARMFTENICI